MSLDACAAMVARADPERFRAAMTAPMPLRGDLMALYAFNLEVARAGVVTAEPLIAAMRLQWWRDVLGEVRAGGAVRAHEVATPLAAVIRRHALPDAPFEALLTARAADMDPDFPTDLPALLDYLRKVSGGMMQLAVRVALSGAGARDAAAGDLGLSQGVAAYLAAMPALQARDRRALPPGGAAGDAVQHLAAEGLAALARARETGLPRRALPATLAAATAPVRLRRAAAAPAAVPTTGPQVSEFRLRLAPLAATLLGRV